MTPDDAAKIAADHTYATWFPPLVVVLGTLALLAFVAVLLAGWLGPRFVRALEALPNAARTIVDVVTAARAGEDAAHAEILAEVRAVGAKVDALARRR